MRADLRLGRGHIRSRRVEPELYRHSLLAVGLISGSADITAIRDAKIGTAAPASDNSKRIREQRLSVPEYTSLTATRTVSKRKLKNRPGRTDTRGPETTWRRWMKV